MIKFGTGGWRAIIGDEFTKANIQQLSQGLCNIMETNEIVIGYDRRFLSDEAAKWVSEVLTANNIKVLFSKKATPTPMTMFIVKEHGLEHGIAITASHNPALYNGVKLFIQGGRDADEAFTAKLENEVNNVKTEEIKTMDFSLAQEKGLIEFFDPSNEYIDAILEFVDEKAIRKAGLKILVDPMFGVSKTSLSMILNTLRCDVDIINDRHDTLFGGKLPSPASANLHQLENLVVEKSYDMGIATDGDADRIGIVDENGHFIHPNTLLALLYEYLLEYKGEKGAVVRNLSTTHLLDKIARHHHEDAIETPVGFKHISENMEKHNALIGGESSGGLTIRGHILGKDGIFAAILLVEMVAVTEKSIGQLVRELENKYGRTFNLERDYRFSQEDKSRINNLLFVEKALPEFPLEIVKVAYFDGLKVYFEKDAWISARFSGTEPLIRVFTEAPSEELAQTMVSNLETFLGITKI